MSDMGDLTSNALVSRFIAAAEAITREGRGRVESLFSLGAITDDGAVVPIVRFYASGGSEGRVPHLWLHLDEGCVWTDATNLSRAYPSEYWTGDVIRSWVEWMAEITESLEDRVCTAQCATAVTSHQSNPCSGLHAAHPVL